jgi:site-specific recombinase XerD
MHAKMHLKIKRNQINFPAAIQSFLGYLEGTGKSALTIKNYRLDVEAFFRFLREERDGKIMALSEIGTSDLKSYSGVLKAKGLKNNTRRRKILTASLFLSYLAKRKKVNAELGHKFPAPHKIERIPFTVPQQLLVEAIQNLETGTLLLTRNRCLLWTLAETGCLVSEVTDLKFEQWTLNEAGQAHVHFFGKFQRSVPVSLQLYKGIQNLRTDSMDSSWIFSGFNRFGSMGGPISSRGVELLAKQYGPKLGFSNLTPRTFRHSVILKWFQEGLSQNEVQSRLGLKTTYAFRSYDLLLKSKTETTSIFENPEQES